LWWWNRDADLDDLGVYFWGSYGLGLLAWEARRQAFWAKGYAFTRLWVPGVLLLLVGGVAWWLEPRPRIAVAWGIAALLVLVPESWFGGESVGHSRWRPALHWLSGVSYSVFLIHFGVCLAVNAAITAHWPDVLWANALGMLLALLLSLLLGDWLHRLVERHPPTVWRWWFWVGAFKASVALALLMNPMV
jgi:peptidoglycan/LPS O-acetylase OafA/YrhL